MFILREITWLRAKKVASELIFLFPELKADRHSAMAQRRLGTDRHMTQRFASEGAILPLEEPT